LFYIVKHGIKFTGMPAWPTQQRDDEVRAIVAFLVKLPELSSAGYRRLVFGEESPEVERAAPLEDLAGELTPPTLGACARCHGEDGLGRAEGVFPKLAGQRDEYMRRALRAYAAGDRHSGVMQPLAVGLSEAEIEALVAYYAKLPRPSDHVADAPGLDGDAQRGEQIAHRGIPSQGLPSCRDCHGPKAGPHNPAYPILAGQHAEYLALQLGLFAQRQRGGSAYAHIMNQVASRLSPQQRRDVAVYYSTLTRDAQHSGQP
jgi:cytochrome c553